MSDDVAKLRATMAELNEQLAALGSVNPEVRARLETALADIHRLLDQGAAERSGTVGGEPSGEHDESIVQRLAAAERHFERTHPTLAGVLGSVIDALARMGI